MKIELLHATASSMASLFYPPWEEFQDRSVKEIFRRGGKILDIGSGLRISKSKANRFDPNRHHKYSSLAAQPHVEYHVSDYTDKYGPDFVEDIHELSFEDNSYDAVFCMAVLEHIESPHKAAVELLRILKPGGQAFIYVPFLYKYHAHTVDYRDYFRYSIDGIQTLFRNSSRIEIQPVRGILETITKMTPLNRLSPFLYAARFADMYIPVLKKKAYTQASGYNVLIVK